MLAADGPLASARSHPYEIAQPRSRYELQPRRAALANQLRFRCCLQTPTPTTTLTTAGVFRERDAQASRALTSIDETFARRLGLAATATARNAADQVYTAAFVLFERELCYTMHCVLCGEQFSGVSTGTLACRYHPFRYVNTAQNAVGYSAEREPPSDCIECVDAHLKPDVRLRRNTLAAQAAAHAGCTPIDHCADVHELLRRPFIAVPCVFWSTLALASRPELRDFARLVDVAGADPRSGVIVVHRASQLAQTLVVDIPATAREVRVSVADVYEQMAARFALEPLADAVYAARSVNPESSISRMSQFTHKDAPRRHALRQLNRKRAHFVPFVLIARVAQCEGGGMRLE